MQGFRHCLSVFLRSDRKGLWFLCFPCDISIAPVPLFFCDEVTEEQTSRRRIDTAASRSFLVTDFVKLRRCNHHNHRSSSRRLFLSVRHIGIYQFRFKYDKLSTTSKAILFWKNCSKIPLWAAPIMRSIRSLSSLLASAAVFVKMLRFL